MWGMDVGRYNPYFNYLNLNDSTSHDTTPYQQEAFFNGTLTATDYPISLFDHYSDYHLKSFVNVFYAAKSLIDANRSTWKTEFRKVIDQFKNHPTVVGYYLFDEFYTGITESDVIDAYDIIKAADPNKPAFANYSSPSYCWESPIRYNDVHMGDFYFFTSPTQGSKTLANEMRQFYGECVSNYDQDKARPFMPILQAYRELPNNPRPTAKQLRNQAYIALVDGATGYWWFTHHDPWRFQPWPVTTPISWTQDLPPEGGGISKWVPLENGIPVLWNEITKVNQEITQYQKVYLSRTANDEYHLQMNVYQSGYYPLRSILKNTGEGDFRYLLVVNTGNTDDFNSGYVWGKVIFPGKNLYSVTSVLDNRAIIPENSAGNPALVKDSFRDPFDVLAVKLYRIDFSAPPSPTPTPPYSCARCSTVNGCEKTTFRSYESSCLTPAGLVARSTDCSCAQITGGDNTRCSACSASPTPIFPTTDPPDDSPTPTTSPTPKPGDYDVDGDVDFLDLIKACIVNPFSIFNYNLVVRNFSR